MAKSQTRPYWEVSTYRNENDKQLEEFSAEGTHFDKSKAVEQGKEILTRRGTEFYVKLQKCAGGVLLGPWTSISYTGQKFTIVNFKK